MNDAGLSNSQREALDTFRKLNGRNWKSFLLANWEQSSYPGVLDPDHAAALQGLRNTFGPEWLLKYRAPALESQGQELRCSPDFWRSPSMDELAQVQNVGPMMNIRAIFGTWPGDYRDEE